MKEKKIELQRVLELKKSGLKAKEIAKILETTEGTIKSTLARAKKKTDTLPRVVEAKMIADFTKIIQNKSSKPKGKRIPLERLERELEYTFTRGLLLDLKKTDKLDTQHMTLEEAITLRTDTRKIITVLTEIEGKYGGQN